MCVCVVRERERDQCVYKYSHYEQSGDTYIMDKFLKSIKFVSLFEQNCSCYLTACEDKKSITLVRKHDWSESGVLPKGAEWRVKWVKDPNGALTRKCRLHSIYKKVLMVRREGEGQQGYLRVCQDTWSALGQESQDSAVEWNLSLKLHSFQEGLGIEAQLIIDYQQVRYFLAAPKYMMCNYDRFVSPTLEPRTSACKLHSHDWIVFQLPNTEHQQKQKDDSKKSNSTNHGNTAATKTIATIATNREVAVVKTPVSNGQLSQLTGWQVGQVVVNYFTSEAGGNYSHYNSGHNVNGSGTQTNGDVNVHTEFGNTRNVSVNFVGRKLYQSPQPLNL